MPELPDPAPTVSQRTHLLYGGLGVGVVALLIRIWAVWHTDVIQRDGVGFITYAREIAVGLRGAVAAHDQHAGYPALLLLAHNLLVKLHVLSETGSPVSWCLAGQAVSVIFGTLATMAVWAMAGLCLNWRTAWVAGGLFAVGRKWVSLGADVMSDATALALFAWALVAAMLCVRGLSRGQSRAVWCAVATGALGGAAYLVRPEGLGAVVVLAVVLLGLALARQVRVGSALLAVSLAVAAAILVASPYMMLIGGVTKKKPVTSLVEVAPVTSTLGAITPLLSATRVSQHPTYGPASDRSALHALLGQTAEATHPILAGLACTFLAINLYHFSLPREKRRSYLPVAMFPQAWVAVATAGLYSAVALRLHMSAGYLDWRHCMPIAFVLAMGAGGAVVALFDFAACFLAGFFRTHRAVPVYIRLHWMWMFPALLAGVSAMSFGPLHGGQEYIRRAADVLRSEPGTFLVTNSRQLFFYTDRPGVTLDTTRTHTADALEQLARMTPPPTHVALSERWLENAEPSLIELLPKDRYRLIATYKCKGETPDVLRVYRVIPLDAAAPPTGVPTPSQMGSAER